MEQSILKSTKKILGLEEDNTAFDLEIITHINTCFSTLLDIGVTLGTMIEDASANWEVLELPTDQLSMVKTYVYLRVRYLFDPPATSFHLDAVKTQIEQMEWRLNVKRENLLPDPPEEVTVDD